MNHKFWLGNVWIHVFGSVYLTAGMNQIGKFKWWSVSEHKNEDGILCKTATLHLWMIIIQSALCGKKVLIIFFLEGKGLRGEMLAWRMSPSSGDRPARHPPHSVLLWIKRKSNGFLKNCTSAPDVWSVICTSSNTSGNPLLLLCQLPQALTSSVPHRWVVCHS